MCTVPSTPNWHHTSAAPPELFWVYQLPVSGQVLDWPLFALKLAPSRVRIWTPSNTWFLGSTQVHIPKQYLDWFSHFAGLIVITDQQTDRPTDRPHYFICSNRPHLASAAMRPDAASWSTCAVTCKFVCCQLLIDNLVYISWMYMRTLAIHCQTSVYTLIHLNRYGNKF